MLQRLLARLSIRAKLWLGFGLLLVVLTVVAAKTLLSLEETDERMGNVVHRIQPAVLDAMALNGELERAAASLGFYLLSKEESQRAAYEASLDEIDSLLAELRGHDLVQRTPELQKLVASVVQKAERFKQYRERMLELATDSGKNFPAISFAAQNINPLSQQALQLMSQMILSESMEEATPERKELLAELNDMRYAWSNVMNGVRAYLAFRNESALQEVGLYQDSVGSMLARLQEKQDLLTFEQADSLEQFVGVRERFVENYAKMQSIHGGPQWRTDAYLVRSEMGPLLEATKADLDALVDRLRGAIESNNAALVEQVNETSTVVSVLLAIGLVLGMMGAWIVSNLIARPIQRAVDTMNDIAEGGGDLTCNMSTDTRDELGEMCTAFNRFVGKIRDIVGPVKSSTDQLSDAAEDLTRIAATAADGVRRQRAETEQVATAMNEMTATAQEMASNAKLAADSAQQADKEAGDGRRVVAQTVDTIQRLADAVERATEVIRRLEADSENIGGVLDVIRGIAEQTNLLALNAAIEAARAGEQGRGFAVVADEVRTLASRSHQSTEEIRSMIEQLQSGARDAVAVMDEGQQHVQQSVDQAAQAGTALEAITRAVATISEMNAHIAHAAEQQGEVAEEINRNISTISRVAEQSASETEQLGSASSQLARLSDELKGLVGHFRT